MSSAHRSRTLARATLTQMGVRVAVITALATLLSYLHIFDVFLAEALGHLERGATRHSQQEQALFKEAESDHAVLRQALQERIREWRALDPNPRFDSLVTRLPDGTLRNRLDGFDGTRMPCIFIASGVKDDADFRRRILAAYDLVARHGPLLHVRHTNTYVTLPEAALVQYWPEQPNWCQEMDPALMNPEFEFFTVSTPERNPERRMVWTGITAEPISISLTTPVDVDGRYSAALGLDMLIDDLKARTLGDSPPGAYNLIFSDAGELIVHPQVKMKPGVFVYNILREDRPLETLFEQPLSAEQRTHVRAIFDRVQARAPGQKVLELAEYDEYLAVAWLNGPQWHLVTVLPRSTVSSLALGAARYLLAFGLASLILELLIMSWVLTRRISQPLRLFTQATDRVAVGDFQVALPRSRDDELGRLAQGFELMAHEIHQREAALREVNEGLEGRITERTRELRDKNVTLEEALTQLKQAQELLVEKERLASLGALMAGIGHELKNPLNFVNNFAQLSAGLVEELREELREPPSGPAGAAQARMNELLDWLTQNVRKIEEHGKRADNLLRDMQLHTHVRAHAHAPTDLHALLEEQLSLSAQNARIVHPDLTVRFRQELDPASRTVEVVPQDLGRALLNLLDNAVYAVAEKHKRLGPAFTPEVTVTSRSEGDWVRIVIRDNGIGIPRKVLDKVFSPFFTTKPAGVGTGLGLSICQDIVVRQHGGELQIESEEGHSTQCTLRLRKKRS